MYCGKKWNKSTAADYKDVQAGSRHHLIPVVAVCTAYAHVGSCGYTYHPGKT